MLPTNLSAQNIWVHMWREKSDFQEDDIDNFNVNQFLEVVLHAPEKPPTIRPRIEVHSKYKYSNNLIVNTLLLYFTYRRTITTLTSVDNAAKARRNCCVTRSATRKE